jgi:hypothetical protein
MVLGVMGQHQQLQHSLLHHRLLQHLLQHQHQLLLLLHQRLQPQALLDSLQEIFAHMELVNSGYQIMQSI